MVWLFQQTDFSLTNILGLVHRLHVLKVKNLVTPESLRVVNRLYQTTTTSRLFRFHSIELRATGCDATGS